MASNNLFWITWNKIIIFSLQVWFKWQKYFPFSCDGYLIVKIPVIGVKAEQVHQIVWYAPKPKIVCYIYIYIFFFFCNPGCPGQLTRTTTNPRTYWIPCKPSRHVRYNGSDRRARWGSNPDNKDKKTLSLLLDHKPRCCLLYFLVQPSTT
jgi:hypothetical protein